MTDREKAIVMAYTGCTMLAGDKLDIFYKYVQEKLGRSVMTHEFAYQEVQGEIKEAAKEDFIAIAKADNGWISVKDRMPEENGNYIAVVNGEVLECTYSSPFIKGIITGWSTCEANGFKWLRDEQVTHWMQLPEPPKEETK